MKLAVFSLVLVGCAVHVPPTPDAPRAYHDYHGTDPTTLAVTCLVAPELSPGKWDCQPAYDDPTTGAWCGTPDRRELTLVNCKLDAPPSFDGLHGCVLFGELEADVTVTDRVAYYHWADGGQSRCVLDSQEYEVLK